MDISLIVTGVITAILPYLQKSGEAFFETAGESIFEKVKTFFGTKEPENIVLREHPNLSIEEISALESKLLVSLQNDKKFRMQIENELKLTSGDAFRVERTLLSIEKLRNQIKDLHEQHIDAGIGSAGDYRNKIRMQQEKLKTYEEEFFKILKG
jgi:hypothetical protein